ncbi:NAD(P)-dependent oxidoreductase [Tenacibaculum finnmarkense]|uniref:Saccharopine dehydrogenase [NAD(+), L-lysine-forming] n=1 Tax=Tenacibaculum finnmarkense genomovar finnmarkense TaxID=1458503 RepID=A0AAP1WFP2_9FLAO|nr:NAD(P)-dependent oxidoreductase [Tenacibaculum finnmarkense]MBE7652318.1 alanine dehydrogenase [Tenacibaculum finnmarkense genomovar finnmarkense]MBE7694510.1 alanine dehydrogenase [Tenacibaculum finnmarkense genomovar finnmarkense]MCD8426697.1 NAD(P)-dependent oxidoreductase [Tenacibaculum finnmarkense genomovar finnmarkense]MCG8730488.1 alanine dehydrogenase [Tenacibaculum finnmarkense]MCG8751016.1 alanine dehydrogenase [Tenacibaculum finnmarkense]
MKFGIIKERKNPPDRRVVFSPEKLQEFKAQFPTAEIVVESSDIRVFSDQAYKDAGLEVVTDMSDCDVLLGVKEVPLEALIPNKKYFFFSHTIKKQPYNRALLQGMLAKNIEMYDHETIIKENGARLIGFGRYAGLVGAYNGFRALGLREKLFTLPKVESLADLDAVKAELDKITLPNIKILVTGTGKVAQGAKEILDYLKIAQISDALYLTADFTEPVYCVSDVMEYNKRIDGKVGEKFAFYKDPSGYQSNFMPYAKVTDFFIAGHFYGDGAPYLFTREDVKHADFKIKYVADISCDVDGPVATTLRSSTIADPIYGYDAQTEKEVDFTTEKAITVMAVDNLPCELPKDASEGFGEMFLKNVIPAFFNDDKDGVLKRAKMTTKNGELAERYAYLQAYVNGEE